MGINEYIQIGSRIKKTRIEKGFTQREMAAKLGLSNSTYSNYENNYREPKYEILEKVSEILGVTLDYLIGLDASRELISEFAIKRYAFIDYLCTLGYSVETPVNQEEDSSNHYIRYNDNTDCKVVSVNDFKIFQEECDNYVTYLVNKLLENSIDIEDLIANEEETNK